MIDQDLVKEKIRNIQEYLSEIKPILALSVKDIISNIEKLRTLERNFQLIVDEGIDINIHFIKEMNLKSPDDFHGTFRILGESKIIPFDFAYKIAPAVGLRNRLVHRYEKLDKKLFIETFKKEFSDFEHYIKYINNYLKTKK